MNSYYLNMTDNNDCHWIIDIAKDIYVNLGRGFPECVYHKAFEVELKQRGITYESERLVPIIYKGLQVGYGRADMIIHKDNQRMVLEFKSVSNKPKMSEMEQLNHYLRHLNISKGILINFGQPCVNQRETIDYVIVDKNRPLPQENEEKTNEIIVN